MRHFKDAKFRPLYDALPPEIRAIADTNFTLLKSNPKHPSLHVKRIRDDPGQRASATGIARSQLLWTEASSGSGSGRTRSMIGCWGSFAAEGTPEDVAKAEEAAQTPSAALPIVNFNARGQAMTKNKNTICVWFDKDAEAAAHFYAATFPDSSVGAITNAPGDYPSGKTGDVLVVAFTVAGIPCIGLNGGPGFKHSEAFSFQIATDDQEETDRYWNAIVGNGGQESACGWCKDKWGINWQITPRVLTEAMAAGGAEAKRAFEAMMHMRKIDVATIEAARRG